MNEIERKGSVRGDETKGKESPKHWRDVMYVGRVFCELGNSRRDKDSVKCVSFLCSLASMTANTEKNSCRPGFVLIYARKKFLAIV